MYILLEGCWHGDPVKVAVLMREEQEDVIIAPSVDAAGGNLDMVLQPKVYVGTTESGMTFTDMSLLTTQLRASDVRALIVDPVMSLFDKNIDIYRANEVRTCLEPFIDVAKAIDGIVIGVTHLNKGQLRDILTGINGSSVFGEVPRCVFGFAHIDAGEHVMEQAKNRAGPRDLKLTYELPVTMVETDDGPTELPRFEITGTSELSIADLTDTDDGPSTKISEAVKWLEWYLRAEQPAPSPEGG